MILTAKNGRTRKETSRWQFSIESPTQNRLGWNPGLPGERPANNGLSQNWSKFWGQDSWNPHEHSSTLRVHCGWYLTHYIDVYTSTKTTNPTSGESFVAKSVTTKSLQELRTVSVNTWYVTLIEGNGWASCWTGTKEERRRNRMAPLTRKQTPRDSPIFTPFYWNFNCPSCWTCSRHSAATHKLCADALIPSNCACQCICHLLWR